MSAPSWKFVKTTGSAEQWVEVEKFQEAEQRQLDQEALLDARYGRQISPDTFVVQMEGFVKKEQSSTMTEIKGLSAQQVDELLSQLRNELTILKTARKESEEQKQELEKLKEEHEKTVAKLKIAEDIAQRDHNLEQKLVSLAEAVLVLKRENEKSFKDLKRRVMKIGGASESEHLKEELLKLKEELEAKNLKVSEGKVEKADGALVSETVKDELSKIKKDVNVKIEQLQNPVIKPKVFNGERKDKGMPRTGVHRRGFVDYFALASACLSIGFALFVMFYIGAELVVGFLYA